MVMNPDGLTGVVAARLNKLAPDLEARRRLIAASGVPGSTFQRLLKGDNEAKASSLMRIARAAGVSIDWLMGLTDERETSSHSPPLQNIERVTTSVPYGFVAVPALEVRASAGSGALSGSGEADGAEIVAFREAWLRSIGLVPGRVHILWASGDSMDPTIRDGDMLLVDRTIDRVVNDGIYVVVAAGVVRVKRVYMRQNGSVVLRSDNDRYPEEIIPADEVEHLVVEGRVKWVGGPI